MAVLIDPPTWPAHGRAWSHLVSDASIEELHAFAAALGLPRQGFEGDHYDVPEDLYAAALALGARAVEPRVLLEALQRSGLRMTKRRGDKGVARAAGVELASGTVADIDLLLSARPVAEARVFAAMVFVRDAAGHFAVVHSVRRQEWGSPGGWREPGESVRDNALREVFEETGLELAAGALRPWGYERFRHVSGPLVCLPERDVLQTFTATVEGVRPALSASLSDTSARRWVTPTEYAALCRDQFWWPLAERLL